MERMRLRTGCAGTPRQWLVVSRKTPERPRLQMWGGSTRHAEHAYAAAFTAGRRAARRAPAEPRRHVLEVLGEEVGEAGRHGIERVALLESRPADDDHMSGS